MPQLRFSKDGRGYENTFVVHASRGKGKSRPRILYWFRTPPGVRVGRTPLDAEAVRLIQATHPDIEFDWPQILKGRPDPVPERTETVGRAERPSDKQDRRDRPGPGVRPAERIASGRGSPAPAQAAEALPPPAIEAEPEAVGPAHARLGSAGLTRLRTRFADLSARIRDRVDDEQLQVELKSVAERLNPDGWRTDDEVLAGLESYEATFEAVKSAIGGRRKPAGAAGSTVAESTDPDETR